MIHSGIGFPGHTTISNERPFNHQTNTQFVNVWLVIISFFALKVKEKTEINESAPEKKSRTTITCGINTNL